MAKNYIEKIIYGMSNIHLAKVKEDGQFEAPVQILGAKSVECSFEVAEKGIFADNKQVYNAKAISGGSGTLEVLGLTPDERRMIMGDDGDLGFKMGTDLKMPQFALLFEMEKADGKKVLYAIYNVQFSPNGISATSVEDGIEEQTVSLEFTAIAGAGDKNLFYYAVDTAEAGAETVAGSWFTQVQMPQ